MIPHFMKYAVTYTAAYSRRADDCRRHACYFILRLGNDFLTLLLYLYYKISSNFFLYFKYSKDTQEADLP